MLFSSQPALQMRLCLRHRSALYWLVKGQSLSILSMHPRYKLLMHGTGVTRSSLLKCDFHVTISDPTLQITQSVFVIKASLLALYREKSGFTVYSENHGERIYTVWVKCWVFCVASVALPFHCTVCLATLPLPRPKQVLFRVRSSASCFKLQYLFFSSR